MNVYITDVASFLPNEPVDNDAIETVLGKVNNIPSRTKRIVLRNNKIEQRHYAIDPETGRMTHSNAQMTAEAIRSLRPYTEYTPHDIECLCCGTGSPDLLFPGHALMVMGELEMPTCEAVTTTGICLSGVTALKYAYLNVAAGCSQNAVATGSELSSSFMRSAFFSTNGGAEADLEKNPTKAFDADFLRWMLSDGAGAMYLSDRPSPDKLSLKIEWFEHESYAGELPTCMFSGGAWDESGQVAGWRQVEDIPEQEKKFLFNVRQDFKSLDKNIHPTMMRTLKKISEKRNLKPDDVDWFLPHYSSGYFRPRLFESLQGVDFEIPYDKWFTNLTTKGNTGSAAIYIILAELLASGNLARGQQLLCFVPESGRFSHCFLSLRVMGPGEQG